MLELEWLSLPISNLPPITWRLRGCSSAASSLSWRISPRWPRAPPCWAAGAPSSWRPCWSSGSFGRAEWPGRSHSRPEVCRGLKYSYRIIFKHVYLYSLEGLLDFSSTDPVLSSYATNKFTKVLYRTWLRHQRLHGINGTNLILLIPLIKLCQTKETNKEETFSKETFE